MFFQSQGFSTRKLLKLFGSTFQQEQKEKQWGWNKRGAQQRVTCTARSASAVETFQETLRTVFTACGCDGKYNRLALCSLLGKE